MSSGVAGLSADMLATDLTEYLVRKGATSMGTVVVDAVNATWLRTWHCLALHCCAGHD